MRFTQKEKETILKALTEREAIEEELEDNRNLYVKIMQVIK